MSFTTSDTRNDTYKLFTRIAIVFINALENIIRIDNQLIYLKMQCYQYEFLSNNGCLSYSEKIEYRKKAEILAATIKKDDPTFDLNNHSN